MSFFILLSNNDSFDKVEPSVKFFNICGMGCSANLNFPKFNNNWAMLCDTHFYLLQASVSKRNEFDMHENENESFHKSRSATLK